MTSEVSNTLHSGTYWADWVAHNVIDEPYYSDIYNKFRQRLQECRERATKHRIWVDLLSDSDSVSHDGSL